MQRTKVILVVLALLASPLALVARGMACDAYASNMLCCPPHAQRLPCHGAAGPGEQCGMNSTQHVPDFGLIAPIAPTKPAALLELAAPKTARLMFSLDPQATAPGFPEIPFEPPRA